ncbi:MAG: hypothetical protein LH606_03230 [Cytophagaceae bacterium]|nr:hypothetical protein [Cytophagaceae bacterium]
MVSSEHTETLKKVIHTLGYADVDTFARVHAIRRLEKKISYCQSRVDFYEQRYGMDYAAFVSRVINREDPILGRFGTLEKEDDGSDWEDSLYFVQSFTDQLRAIE